MERPIEISETELTATVWKPIPMEMDETASANAERKERVGHKLADATQFEIHCWKEEKKEIEMALRFGTIQDVPWEYGTVISGCVTPEFREYLHAQSEVLI